LISDDGLMPAPLTLPAQHGIGGIAVVANEPAGTRRYVGACRGDQRIDMGAARLNTYQSPVGKSRLESANERSDPTSESFQRSEHSQCLRSGREDSSPPTIAVCKRDAASRSVIAAAISASLA
jgi:hypothetical protein